jgi:uncharacterized membrane protein
MIRTIAWFLAAGLFAISVHIAYVMFIPREEMNQVIGESARIAGMNRFTVLSGEQQEHILNESGKTGLIGLCPYDLSRGRLVFDASLPDAVWSFTVYSESGEDSYALNEVEAGTNRFQLTITPSPGLIGLLSGEGSDAGMIGDGWTVETRSRRGVAIVWVALEDARLRSSYADVVSKSSCRLEPDGQPS